LLLDVSRLIWRRWEGTRATGIDRICSAWLEHYSARSQAVVVHRFGQAILPLSTSQALFRLLTAPTDRAFDKWRFRLAMVLLALFRGWQLARQLPGHGRFWLNPGHTGLNSPRLAKWIEQSGIKPIYLVCDLIPITHPQFCRPGEDERHRQRMRTVIDTGAGIIAISTDTLRNLADFAADEGGMLAPAVVAWLGIPKLPTVPAAVDAEPTFVVLGTIEGRKNHILLLKIWQNLVQRLGAQAPKLLIVGRRGWQADHVFEILDGHDFGGKVIELGALDDRALAQVLVNARALLFPSFAEGYGMPLVEALALGVPVIASDLPVFEEIGQGIPEFVPPDDEAGWTQAILEYAKPDSELRSAQLTRLVRFQPPEWDTHFSIVDQLLESATT
jgi:glycosyltransferase involved in cell wall biosynthesis